MKTYRVKEMFYSIQGEGANVGRSAVFVRFSGCNGWNGLESGRGDGRLRCSTWCDTDFVGQDGTLGGVYGAGELAEYAGGLWPDSNRGLVILTGGEPALQADARLISALRSEGLEVAIETNGTIEVPLSLDWITVSPKFGGVLRVTSGQELKLVYPQPGVEPRDYRNLNFRHFFLQPMDGPDVEANTRAAVEYCLRVPHWRLSLQIHKSLSLR